MYFHNEDPNLTDLEKIDPADYLCEDVLNNLITRRRLEGCKFEAMRVEEGDNLKRKRGPDSANMEERSTL